MKSIIVKELVETGFSTEDAQILYEAAEKILNCQTDKNEKVTIDFEGVRFFTTQFFNNSVSRYVLSMGPESFNEKFNIINLSEAGLSTYQHSYNNAVSYFNLPGEKRIMQDQIVEQDEEIG